MISDHPFFLHPLDKQIKIWRYMSLKNARSLLETDVLFFSRADKLGDPFEGSTTQATLDLYKEAIANPLDPRFAHYGYSNASPEEIKEMVEKLSKIKENITRQQMFVNCWHMNESECALMWGNYAKYNQSVCIQSTFQKLCDVLPNSVHVGKINYIDYKNEYIREDNRFPFFLHKRTEYAGEREIRAIYDLRRENNLKGFLFPIQVKNLIETIYVHPKGYESIQRILMKKGLDIPLKLSALYDKAQF